MNRFELNSMLERLLESDGQDAEAREAIAGFAAGMRKSWNWRFQSHISTSGDKITGQTNLGTVQVEDGRPEAREMSLGEREVRIGQYKLVRQGRNWRSRTSGSPTSGRSPRPNNRKRGGCA